MIAVPPGLLLILAPERLSVDWILSEQIGRHAFDDCLGGEVRFRKLCDRLAPSDLAVVRGDLDETEMSKRVEVVRLGIADGNWLDFGDLHRLDLTRWSRGRAACPRLRRRLRSVGRSS